MISIPMLSLAAVAAVLVLQCILLTRRSSGPDDVTPKLDAVLKLQNEREGRMRDDLKGLREETAAQGKDLRQEVADALKRTTDSLGQQLAKLTDSNEVRFETLRGVVEGRLKEIREDNTKQLEQMRQTVDEKLQGTLEKRLGESFKQVSERLEEVHRGLGEMQSLASGVGDLKKVLSNEKARGVWGEVQLGALLEQVLTPDQYVCNFATREGSNERVEFAIRMPGRDGAAGDPVWLPIDAKFPQEDYIRIVDASERADPEALELAARQLETRIKGCARDIHEKYLCPPRTTDFGVLFLPTEGLYAEVLRRPGLVELLQREYRVNVSGPTTLAALLNSLQMGFRTLAIQQRSSEVWALLGSVKNEFGKFGTVLDAVKEKLQQATRKIDDAFVRTRQIERKLKDVQALPAGEHPPFALEPPDDLAADLEVDEAGV